MFHVVSKITLLFDNNNHTQKKKTKIPYETKIVFHIT